MSKTQDPCIAVFYFQRRLMRVGHTRRGLAKWIVEMLAPSRTFCAFINLFPIKMVQDRAPLLPAGSYKTFPHELLGPPRDFENCRQVQRGLRREQKEDNLLISYEVLRFGCRFNMQEAASSVLDKKERRDEKGAGRGRSGRGRARGRGRGRGRPRKAPAAVPDDQDPGMSSDSKDADVMDEDAKVLMSTPEPVRGRLPRSPEPVAQNLGGPEPVAQNVGSPELVAQNPSPEIKQESKKQKTLAAQEGRRLKAEDALERVRQCSHEDLQPDPGFDKVRRGCMLKAIRPARVGVAEELHPQACRECPGRGEEHRRCALCLQFLRLQEDGRL